MNTVVNLKEKLAKLNEHWSPRVVGEFDGNYAKIAKLKGTFTWHKHDDEDELFLVISGTLVIEIENHPSVTLNEGELYIVPKGVMHNPIAEKECHVLVIEKKSTQHTGDTKIEKTRSIEDQLKPI
ncbi:Cupin domain protein [Verrucomicrobiia bacterium DG1235]|nr:Cupin domain protein [Verrucomicrobiae bacterium DG1235]